MALANLCLPGQHSVVCKRLAWDARISPDARHQKCNPDGNGRCSAHGGRYRTNGTHLACDKMVA